MLVLFMVFILLASNTMIEKKIVKSKIAILLFQLFHIWQRFFLLA